MKKIFMFLLMACLVGGFANSANAQKTETVKPKPEKAKKAENSESAQASNANAQRKKSNTPFGASSAQTSGITDLALGQFESEVKKCVEYYSYTPQENFNLETYSKYYNNAKERKGKLEKNKASFSSSQLDRFNTAVERLSGFPTPDEVQREKAARAEDSGKKNKPISHNTNKPQH